MKLEKLKNIFNSNFTLLSIVLIIFLYMTLPLLLNHVPNQDEAQNYMVSHFMTFNNFLDVLNSHGHAIIWYLLLKPFSQTNILYPYPMLFINYFILLSAIIVMWLKAPFNNYFKIIITFSSNFIFYYAIHARCYAIGILGFFILAALYKDQLKRPVLYSLVLGLTANTSAYAAIGTIGLLLPFLYNLFSQPIVVSSVPHGCSRIKSIILPLIIILSSFTFLIIPHCMPFHPFIYGKLHLEITEFFLNINFAVPYFLIFLILLFNKSNISSKFFLIFTFVFTFIFALKIYGQYHHIHIFIVYLIVTMWIQNETLKLNSRLCLHESCDIVFL